MSLKYEPASEPLHMESAPQVHNPAAVALAALGPMAPMAPVEGGLLGGMHAPPRHPRICTLVSGPRRSLSDTRVYEPEIRARLGTTANGERPKCTTPPRSPSRRWGIWRPWPLSRAVWGALAVCTAPPATPGWRMLWTRPSSLFLSHALALHTHTHTGAGTGAACSVVCAAGRRMRLWGGRGLRLVSGGGLLRTHPLSRALT